jgi:hypothetical protein
MTTDGIPHDADRDDPETTEVPAGGAGADSGAAASVGVDETDRADVQNISSQNDIAGVGTRGGEGGATASTDVDESAVEQERRAADPAFTREDEAAGAASHNARVSTRDSADPVRAQSDDDFQHLPRMAQNAPTPEEEFAGIVAQTQADVSLGIPDSRIPRILRQRLDDAGIAYDDDTIDELARRVRE